MGSRFIGWDGTTNTGDITIDPITSDVSHTATFVLNGFVVSASTTGNGSVEGTGNFNYGDKTTLVAKPGAGSHFVGWDGTTSTDNIIIDPITSDVSHAATFALDTFTISTTTTGDGIVEGTGTFNYDGKTTLIAKPGVGSHCVGWDGTANTGNITIDPIRANESHAAAFALDENNNGGGEKTTYTVTATAGANGQISIKPEQEVYNADDEVTFTATPDEGYEVYKWTGVDSSEGTWATLKVDGNEIVTVSFKAIENGGGEKPPVTPENPPESRPVVTQYYLSISVVGPGSVFAPSGSLDEGTVVVMNVTANAGAHFVRWEGPNGGDVSGDSIQMTGNKSITAVFEADQAPVVEVPEDQTPQSGQTTDENSNSNSQADQNQVVLDEAVPQGSPELPKTGGIPIELLISMGAIFTTGGVTLRRFKKKDEEK